MGFIISDVCPCCGSASVGKELSAEDYTVSHQVFEIWQCADCLLRFTQNIPDSLSAGQYYQSDAYISHTDTSEGIVNKLYHIIRKKTLQKKRWLVQQTTQLQKGSLLEIGAGTGAFVNAMQAAGWQVTGLEPDAAARQRALSIHGVELQNSPALFQLSPQSFDAITMWHVLEHVHELHAYIAQVKVLLTANGRALIAVPNYTSYDAAVYRSHWAAYDVPRHLYHFSPIAMEKLLKQHGLKLITVRPMWYDSFYIAMLSEQYKNARNNFIKAAWVGLISNCMTLFNKKRCSSLIYLVGKIN